MSDELKKLFEGKELSDNFVEKAEAVLESIVETKTAEIEANYAEISEKHITFLDEENVKKNKTDIEERTAAIEQYLDYVITEWRKDNEKAIESEIKVGLAESMFESLKTSLSEHNIVVPEDGVNLVQKTETELSETRTKLDKQIAENVNLKTELDLFNKTKVIDKVCSELSESQKEKVEKAAVKMVYESDEDYSSKVSDLVETFFGEQEQQQEEELEESVSTFEKGSYFDELQKSL